MKKPTAARAQSPETNRSWLKAQQAALKNAASTLRGLAGLLGAVAALFVAYYTFETKLKLHEPWPAVICALSFLLFVVLFFVPELRDQLKLQRLRDLGINGKLVDPGYFRLSPYEAEDASRFQRPDDVLRSLSRWIETTPKPLLYLTGQSGVGKSSLIGAALVPAMAKQDWIVVVSRPQDDPLQQIRETLLQPKVIWTRAP
jgi:hypothetical protein